MKELLPEVLAKPFGNYAHGTLIPASWRVVRSSGQLGMRADGTIPDGTYEQAVICFENLRAILAEAGMGPGDVAHVSGYVTDRAYFADYMRARDDFMGGTRLPSSTLLIVSGFTKPEFKVEAELWAAAP